MAELEFFDDYLELQALAFPGEGVADAELKQRGKEFMTSFLQRHSREELVALARKAVFDRLDVAEDDELRGMTDGR